MEGLGSKRIRKLACRITGAHKYFISESSVDRILKSHDLIARPAYILMQEGDLIENQLDKSTNSGRRILLTSESLPRAGITCQRYSMIFF